MGRGSRGLALADLAHAIALVEGGDLAGDDARALVRGLLELHAIPGDEFPWDPSLGDAFNAREAELERRVGRSAAGWLSAGRPRREAFRVALRLTARSSVRELHDTLVDQAAALVRRAQATRARSPPTRISSRHSRPRSATCFWRMRIPPCATPSVRVGRTPRSGRASPAPAAAPVLAGRSTGCALPTCLAVMGWSSMRRTPRGRPTCTSSCSRRLRSRRPIRARSARTSRSTPARSSG